MAGLTRPGRNDGPWPGADSAGLADPGPGWLRLGLVALISLFRYSCALCLAMPLLRYKVYAYMIAQ